MKAENKIDSFSDLRKCVHYCSVGGHLWTHPTTRDKQGRSLCDWRMNDPNMGDPVVKFFSVCPDHRSKS